jgi:Flp pilus assembly protein CpaB
VGDPNQLLAGTLQAGGKVDLVANLHQESGSGSNVTKIVLRDLTVLTPPADSSKTGGAGGAGSGNASAIVAVTDTQVQRLFFVFKNADWTLELRPVVNAVDSNDRSDDLSTIMRGR